MKVFLALRESFGKALFLLLLIFYNYKYYAIQGI